MIPACMGGRVAATDASGLKEALGSLYILERVLLFKRKYVLLCYVSLLLQSLLVLGTFASL